MNIVALNRFTFNYILDQIPVQFPYPIPIVYMQVPYMSTKQIKTTVYSSKSQVNLVSVIKIWISMNED